MQLLIDSLVNKHGETLVNVPADVSILEDMGFSHEEASERVNEVVLKHTRHMAIQRLNADYNQALSVILAEYPDAEQMSWGKQEAEARALLADSAAATPLLDAIASARGTPRKELATRVIEKADAWAKMSGLATGKRQALEERIQAATTVDEIKALTW